MALKLTVVWSVGKYYTVDLPQKGLHRTYLRAGLEAEVEAESLGWVRWRDAVTIERMRLATSRLLVCD